MKFTADREPMLAALSFVRRYVETKANIPVLTHVKLTVVDGKVSVTGTDLEQTARDSFAAEIDADGAICLPAQLLFNAVKSAPGSEILVTADDKTATIVSGRMRARLPILPVSDFPEMDILAAEGSCGFTMPTDLLKRVKQQVTFAREPDGGRFSLIGTCWRQGSVGVEFCSTDGKVMSMLVSDIRATSLDIIVPDFDVPDWSGDVSVTVKHDRFIRLTNGGQTLASKLIEASFPDFRRLIPDNQTVILFDREQLLAAVNRAAIVADASLSVMMVGRDGMASVSSDTPTGAVSGDVPYEGDDFQVAFAHKYIAPVLASFDCENIELRWNSHAEVVSFQKPGDDGRIALAFPFMDRRLADYLTDTPVAVVAA